MPRATESAAVRCDDGSARGARASRPSWRGCCASAASAIPTAAARFLNPSLDHLHDPMALADMRRGRRSDPRAPSRARERIAIHGDYDVDGITSTVILRRALELLGADVVHFIPERLKDGYGLQPAAIERLHADGVALIVSVDCGIRGAEAARRARELGVDLIITDHHEPDTELPPALAVINPEAARLPLSGQEPGRRRRRAEAGAGALPPAPGATAGCPASSRSPPSARWPTSCRSSARTASSPSSASTC